MKTTMRAQHRASPTPNIIRLGNLGGNITTVGLTPELACRLLAVSDRIEVRPSICAGGLSERIAIELILRSLEAANLTTSWGQL